jgi:hypothetical protein
MRITMFSSSGPNAMAAMVQADGTRHIGQIP